MPNWLNTAEGARIYWLRGTFLLSSVLLLPVIDWALAPRWHAPHPHCDTPAALLGMTILAMVVWVPLSAIVSALIVLPCAWKKAGGKNVLDFRLGKPIWREIISVPFLAALAFLAWELYQHVRNVFVSQSITMDCDGRAYPMTFEMHAPVIQLYPVWVLLLALWILHLRALAVSPRIANPEN